MTTAEKLVTVAENQQRVYDAGYEKGKAEGGGGIDYDAFWDTYQDKGARRAYIYAFAFGRFSDETYNPKYDIITEDVSYVFYNATITDTKVPMIAQIDGRDFNRTFASAKNLVTVRRLVLAQNHAFTYTFSQCTALKNITIEGTISKTISFSQSPLTRDSIMSVYNALSTTATGQTVTFKKSAVTAAFTDAEWEALKAEKPNWTYALA